MTYKQILTNEMTRLSKDKRIYFLGYNVKYGPRMNGTLCNVPKSKCIELPVAENLIMGLAMGMSLEGYIPIVCFERMDFMLVAADAIINHLDKIPKLSNFQFDFRVIIRCCVGNDEPLDPGIQHKSDYTELFQNHTGLSVCSLSDNDPGYIKDEYQLAIKYAGPSLIVEYKDLYNT